MSARVCGSAVKDRPTSEPPLTPSRLRKPPRHLLNPTRPAGLSANGNATSYHRRCATSSSTTSNAATRSARAPAHGRCRRLAQQRTRRTGRRRVAVVRRPWHARRGRGCASSPVRRGPGSCGVDRLTRPRVVRHGVLKERQHVLGAGRSPLREQAMVGVRELSAAVGWLSGAGRAPWAGSSRSPPIAISAE